MNKRATKKQIYKACEAIETEKGHFSCCQIRKAVMPIPYEALHRCKPVIDYAKFYEKRTGDFWYDDSNFDPNYGYKSARILAMLFYLEARDDM